MSSSQVIRLGSGDTIQVRTGTIQGVGPQGPSGPAGPAGPVGVQGDVGPRGEMGQIAESAIYATGYAEFQIINPSTWTPMEMAVSDIDTYGARYSSTTYKLPVGYYNFGANATFARSTGVQAGARKVRLLVGGLVLWEASQNALNVDLTTSLSLAGGLNIKTEGLEVKVEVWHNDTVSLGLSVAQLWVARAGSGLVGPAGPQGIEGRQGTPGEKGDKGDAGALGDDNTTFAALGG